MNAPIPTYLLVLPWSLDHAGGVNQVVKNLGREINASGMFNVLVLISDWEAMEPVWGESYGLRTLRWRVHGWQSNMGMKERLGYWIWERRFAPQFYKLCHDLKIRVINFHYPGASAFSLQGIISRMTSPPKLVFSFHGTDVNTHREGDVASKEKWRQLLRISDGVVACSKDLREAIREVFGEEIDPVVIHNGIAAEQFISGASAGIPLKRRIILSVGKFDEVKGQDILIKAFALIATYYPDVDLVFVGSSGNALPRLNELCSQEGIQDRVVFHQNLPHHRVSDFFKFATLFVLPSRREALGIVILEAGAFALPVVASRVGGIPEILREGDTGLLVTPDVPELLADAIRSILDNPSDAIQMGMRLRDLVKANFTWTAARDKYLDLISNGEIAN